MDNAVKIKLGRNELCHCGSGKKYKKCCLDRDTETSFKRYDYNINNKKEKGEIWILRIKCVFGIYLKTLWVRRIEIDSNSSLASLHHHINKMIDFDFDHLFDFYAGRNFNNKKHWFTKNGEYSRDIDYNDVYLSKVFPLPESLKLYYLFDFGDNWVFEIRKERKKIKRLDTVKYPRIIESIGENPEQYPSYEF